MESSTSSCPSVVPPPSTEFVLSLGSLYGYLAKLTDRRKRRGIRDPLATILVLAILAKLCGQDKPSGIADWVHQRRRFLGDALRPKRGRLAHHTAYRSTIASVACPERLEL